MIILSSVFALPRRYIPTQATSCDAPGTRLASSPPQSFCAWVSHYKIICKKLVVSGKSHMIQGVVQPLLPRSCCWCPKVTRSASASSYATRRPSQWNGPGSSVEMLGARRITTIGSAAKAYVEPKDKYGREVMCADGW